MLYVAYHLFCVILQSNSTALHAAAMGGHYNIVTFLCSLGAGVDVTDWQVSSVPVCMCS